MRVEFLFDFGSPNAYLAHKVVPGIARRTGARFDYVPVLLGGIFKLTGNRPPALAFAGIKGKLEYEMREIERFVKRHGLSRFAFNPHFPVNTLLVMRGAVAAEMEGKLAPYVDAVMAHMWEEGLKMDDPEVARAALDRAGLDGGRLLARAGAPEVKAKLLADTESAVARGVFGIPSFFAGGELWFGKDRLRDVEEAIRESSAPD